MKKIALVALLMMAMVGCSEDNDIDNPADKPFISEINTSKKLIALGQNVVLKVEGNTDPDYITWYANDKKIGTGDSIVWHVGKKEATTLKVVSKTNDGIELTKQKAIDVIDCDFGKAVWGDTGEDVILSETGALINNSRPISLKYIADSGNEYFYKMGNDKVVSGTETIRYIIQGQGDGRYRDIALKYQSVVYVLTKKIGEYSYCDMDLYDMKTEEGRTLFGFQLYRGVNALTRLENERTSVELISVCEIPGSFKFIIEYKSKQHRE